MKRVKSDEEKCVGSVVRSFLKSSEFSLDHNCVRPHWISLKSMAKRNIRSVFDGLIPFFSAKRAKGRLCALLICNELFLRSVEFRKLTCANLMDICDHCLGTDPHNPIPEMETVGSMLKQQAKVFLHDWHQRFVPKTPISSTSDYRKQLDVVYHFLKQKKNFVFVNENDNLDNVVAIRSERNINDVRRENALREWTHMEETICLNMLELENGLSVLFPTFEDIYDDCNDNNNNNNNDEDNETRKKRKLETESMLVPEVEEMIFENDNEEEKWEEDNENDKEDDGQNDNVQYDMLNQGITNDYEIQVTVKTSNLVEQSDANEPVVRVVKEARKVLLNHMQMMSQWEVLFRGHNDETVSRIQELQQRAQSLCKQMQLFNI